MATRRERVVLELQDELTTGMARAAAATALLNRELDALDGQSVNASRSTNDLDKSLTKTGRSANVAGSDLDKFTGRARVLAEVVALVAPASVAVGAVAVPALTGMASSLGFAGVAAGTFAIAFNGMGDALDAVSKARLEPTTENLEKAREALQRLSPEARGFARQIQGLNPELQRLRDIAGQGLFIGLGAGLEGLETALPRVERVIAAISTELGSIASDAGSTFTQGRWDDFLDFLAEEGPAALSQLATAAGNTIHALTELWIATDPLNDDFMSWLVRATADLDRWAEGLSQTQGFQEFVAYIRENGPQVGETIGAIANAFLQVVEAAAPLGGPVLQIIEALADGLAAIANSPIGTPLFSIIAAMSALNLAVRAYQGVSMKAFGGPGVALIRRQRTELGALRRDWQSFNAVQGFKAGRTGMISNEQIVAADRFKKNTGELAKNAGKAGLAIGGLAVVTSGAAEQFGLANTASLALMGSLGGPWGAAIGGAVGLLQDLTGGLSVTGDELRRYQESIIAPGAGDPVKQLELITAEIEKQQAIVSDAAFSLDLGITTISSNDGAAKARDKIDGLKDAEEELRHQIDLQAIATSAASTIQGRNAAASQRQAAALNLARDAARQSGEQFITLGRAIENPAVSLRDWTRQLRNQAKALEDFTANSLKTARRGLRAGLIDELRSKGPAGALRLKELAEGTNADIVRANRAWLRGQAAIQDNVRAAEELRRITAKIELKLKTDRAKAQLDEIVRLVSSQPIRMRADIVANYIGFQNKPKVPTLERADGGTIPGQRWPYRDKVLMLGAPGEEVITNRHGEADRFRADRAAGRIPAYANGGTVANPDWSRVRVPSFAGGGTVGSVSVSSPVDLSGMTVMVQIPGLVDAVRGLVTSVVSDGDDMSGMRGRTK